MGIHGMWSGRTAILKDLLPVLSGLEIFLNQIKWCRLQDRSLAHEMADGKVNM
jgi:hypothetical protein